MILFIVCTIVIGAILGSVWLLLTYISVSNIKTKVCETYSDMNEQLKKRYNTISDILSLINQSLKPENSSILDDITLLKNELLSLGDNIDNADRRIALDNELDAKMQNIISALENSPELMNNQNIKDAIQSYNNEQSYIDKAGIKYNSAAGKLKIAVENSQESFAARLCGIKSVNMFRAIKNDKKLINTPR